MVSSRLTMRSNGERSTQLPPLGQLQASNNMKLSTTGQSKDKMMIFGAASSMQDNYQQKTSQRTSLGGLSNSQTAFISTAAAKGANNSNHKSSSSLSLINRNNQFRLQN